MRTFIAIISFVLSYACLFTCVAGFFAMVTPATFYDITSHPGYLGIGSIIFLILSGFVADDVYTNHGQN